MAFVPTQIIDDFQSRYRPSVPPLLYRAPGRVNLIGEHTDYNLGYVLPIALEMACYVAIAPADRNDLRIYSQDVEDEFSIKVSEIADARPQGKWHDYVIGVARELVRLGVPVSANDMYIRSEVPAGAGLSSSASLEISSALALLGDGSIEPLSLREKIRVSGLTFDAIAAEAVRYA